MIRVVGFPDRLQAALTLCKRGRLRRTGGRALFALKRSPSRAPDRPAPGSSPRARKIAIIDECRAVGRLLGFGGRDHFGGIACQRFWRAIYDTVGREVDRCGHI
jgi:hypothetical protein